MREMTAEQSAQFKRALELGRQVLADYGQFESDFKRYPINLAKNQSGWAWVRKSLCDQIPDGRDLHRHYTGSSFLQQLKQRKMDIIALSSIIANGATEEMQIEDVTRHRRG